MGVHLTQLAILTMVVAAPRAALSQSPYPKSPVITGISFDKSTHDRRAPGSDNWQVTWADDDHQYTAWGDGGGFGGTNSDGRVSLGVARVEGPATAYNGFNVWGGKSPEVQATFGGKSYGIISIAKTLYMWVSPGSGEQGYTSQTLYSSIDKAHSWTKVSWAFNKADKLVFPTFLQFGKDYAGARDGYVYIYVIRLQDDSKLEVQKPGQIDLLRVPKADLLTRSAYTFFAGLDAAGAPTWTSDIAARKPVFTDPNGVGWTVSASYNVGLKRYLLCTEHGKSFDGRLGIFDAPEPWGPWTSVAYHGSDWEGFGTTFFWNFSNKWISGNGKQFTLVFTGIGANDSWNTIRGTFTAVTPPDASAPPMDAAPPADSARQEGGFVTDDLGGDVSDASPDDDGCACHLAGTPPPTVEWFLLLLLVGLVRRSRS